MADSWTVVGIGNSLRGDDAVGPVVAGRSRGLPGVGRVIDDADPFDIADLLADHVPLVLIDATLGGGLPGSITVWEPCHGSPRPVVGASSHGFGADAALELAVALGLEPSRVVVVGIEGECFEGDGLSRPVAAAVDRAVAAVAGVVAHA